MPLLDDLCLLREQRDVDGALFRVGAVADAVRSSVCLLPKRLRKLKRRDCSLVPGPESKPKHEEAATAAARTLATRQGK